MVQLYQALEGELSVRSTDTTSRSGTANSVALVGGYDAANAASEVTAGESTTINDATAADNYFGTSELSRAAAAVGANGVGTIYGVPVGETSSTEAFGSSTATASGTLANAPVFDPSLHPDHSITVTDVTEGVDCTVEYVYNESPTAPSESNTVVLDLITGEWTADSSSEYEFQYTYGDYQTAIQSACATDARYVIVLTEAGSVKSTLVSELQSRAQDFDFKRGVVGATPEISTSNISNYSPSQENWRLVEVAPARATGANGAVRTAAAVGGFLASQPIGPDGSGLFDPVAGLSSLNKSYRPSDVKDFGQVTALTETATIGTAETTSSAAQFKPIYATEIIDRVALNLFAVARDYAGGPQDAGDLEAELGAQLQSASSGNPPLLGFGDGRNQRPYDVSVSLSDSNTTADAGITIIPYPIADTVNVSLTVADGFVEFGGASA